MRVMSKSLLAAALSLLAMSAAWADVSVSFVKPDEFSDVPRSVIDRERLQKEFAEYFASLGKKLPAGQNLKIEVTDIDLAGRMIPRRAADDIRVMNGGADWPRMELRYTLEQDGKVLRSADKVQLSDMNYQQNFNNYSSGDPLRYEKRMIEQWFDKTFVPARMAAAH